MIEPSISHESFTVTRDYAVPVERAFAAFADPQKKRRWFAEGDAGDRYQLDFRVGGTEVSVFRVDTPEFKSDEIRNHTYFDMRRQGTEQLLASLGRELGAPQDV